jgi:tetratricopeptide (TPR) repeat protein
VSNTERVIKYLDGELSEVEVLEFEKLLKSDPDLSKELNFVKDIEKCFQDKSLETFKSSLQRARQNFVESEQSQKGRTRVLIPELKRYSRIAAVVLILITSVVAVVHILSLKPNRNEKLFTQYFQPYQGDVSSRSDANAVTNLQFAFQAYNNKQYHEAISLFDKVLASDNSMLRVCFYKGISSIECGDFMLALNSFKQVTSNLSSPYYAQSRWYMALTWLKLNKPENAKLHLEWLIQNDSYYGKKASAILAELNKN